MKLRPLLFFFPIIVIVSCGKSSSPEAPKELVVQCTTLPASTVTSYFAKLNGKAFIENAKSSSGKGFFYLSDHASDLASLQAEGTIYPGGDVPATGGEFACSLETLDPETTYYYVASIRIDNKETFGSVLSFTTVAGPPKGAIDMGLSVYWAQCNLGASNEVDFGDYYCWGETEPRHFTKSTGYKFFVTTDDPYPWNIRLTKYCPTDKKDLFWGGEGEPDNKLVLDPEDDAARVIMGGKWRMPTSAEFHELCNNCSVEWTSFQGVKGVILTSKVKGFEWAHLFFPAAGEMVEQENNLYGIGLLGGYWSSNLDTDFSVKCAQSFYFTIEGPKDFFDYGVGGGGDRDFGYSIRPVYE